VTTFLSDEYMAEATEVLGGHAGFGGASSGVELSLQFVVTDHPAEGELPYYLRIDADGAELSRGRLDEPDVTVTNTYETAVGISKGDLNTQMAFMTGKLKVEGNMAKLMMNQNVINEFARALSGLDVAY
jgi:putative sterol carrier protein